MTMAGSKGSKADGKKKESFKDSVLRNFKSNYVTSLFLIGMVVGAVFDYSMGTMPRITCGCMVLAIVIGSCMNVKKRNETANREEQEQEMKDKTLL